jgi:Gram-negative bacterial TonB protein C-terminal
MRNANLPLILLICCVATFGQPDQQPTQDLPVVTDAAVPFYPPRARLAHIEGVVRLQVSTDGEKVSVVELLEGQPVLALAAKENVKTWRLKWHARTTFEATFRYKLLPEFVCEADNPTVLLRLPLEVEVSTKGLKTCDPSVEIRSKKHDHPHP